MRFGDFGNYDAVGLAELVRKREVTPKELLNEAIERIEKVDPKINAVVVKHYEYAERQIAEGLPEGHFTGVPFLLKDDFVLEGTRTTFGASLYNEYIADRSRTFARRILKSGLTILGKTATPELSSLPTTESRLHGPTRNPWNLNYSVGGSSGGAAAVVAARILPVAHGGDGGGSIRIPASACGVFGLKPTRGRNPIGPDSNGWAGFACPHVLSMSVRDSAAMLDALSGPELAGAYHAPPPERPFVEEVKREPGRLRIAFTAESTYGDRIDPEIAAAVREIAALLDKLGHHVEERAPVLPADPAEVLEGVVGAQIAMLVRLEERRLGRATTERDLEFSTLAKVHRAQKATATDYIAAELAGLQISRALAEFFQSCDVFLSPTLCAPPLPIGELNSTTQDLSLSGDALRRYMPGTSMFNMSGQPAMSVPLAWSSAGLPLGMMFAGRFGEEATLLRLAAQLEQERPWDAKRPSICA